MARGNQGKKICPDDHDREMRLATTVQAWTRSLAQRSVLHAAQKSNFLSISLQFPMTNFQ
jgi:hypothetical protein